MEWLAVLIVLGVVALVLWWYFKSSGQGGGTPTRPKGETEFAEFGVRVVAASNFDSHRFSAQAPIAGLVPSEKKELGIRVIRPVFDLVVTGPDDKPVTTFDPPLTITMKYTAKDAEAAGGAERLGVFLYSPSNNKWKHFKPTIDAAAQSATFELAALLGTDDPIGFDT
jgi:hypothetical protein